METTGNKVPSLIWSIQPGGKDRQHKYMQISTDLYNVVTKALKKNKAKKWDRSCQYMCVCWHGGRGSCFCRWNAQENPGKKKLKKGAMQMSGKCIFCEELGGKNKPKGPDMGEICASEISEKPVWVSLSEQRKE